MLDGVAKKPKSSLQRANERLWLQHQPLGNQKGSSGSVCILGRGPHPLRSPRDPSEARSGSVLSEDPPSHEQKLSLNPHR